jgi:hypothetical protein
MNASMFSLAVLIGTLLLTLSRSHAEEPKSAAQTTRGTKSHLGTESLGAATSRDAQGRNETSSKQSISTAKDKVPDLQVRPTPRDRLPLIRDFEITVSPRRPAVIPPSKGRTLPNVHTMPQNPFQQPVVAIPTAATIGGRLPIQYASPGVQATQLTKVQFPLTQTWGNAPRAPTAPAAPTAPKAHTAGG